jgi:hypothetical protein
MASGVGGFLGMGEHSVAVPMEKLKWVNEPVRTSSTTTTPADKSMVGVNNATTGEANRPIDPSAHPMRNGIRITQSSTQPRTS